MLQIENIELSLEGFTFHGSLSLARGEHLSLIGPSGGGKSTLLNLIAGFIAPDAGQIRIDGRDMAGVSPAKRPVTMLFQEHNLFPHLTAAENIGLGIDPGLKLSATDRKRISAALEEVGLHGLEARRPAALSGGNASAWPLPAPCSVIARCSCWMSHLRRLVRRRGWRWWSLSLHCERNAA